MTIQQHNIQTAIVQKTLWGRKLLAFLVVAIATFLLLSLAWPLSVRNYVSRGVVEVDVIKTPTATNLFKQQLSQIVQRHTTGDAVSRLAEEADASVKGRTLSELAASDDFPSRFGVRLVKGHEEGIFRLNVTYRGKGTKTENYMVGLMTTNIARDFLASPHAQLGTGKILTPTQSPTSIGQDADDLIAQSEQLNQQALGIVARLETGRSSNGSAGFGSTNASPFMNVGHSTGRSPDPETEIADLKRTLGQMSHLVRESTIAGNQHSGNIAFSVRSVNAQRPTPVGGVPPFRKMLLLAGISSLLATVVTIAYRPFENKGFENIASVVHKLGVPVVATLNDVSKDGHHSEASSGQTPWANRVVEFAELALFAITIIAIGFCVFNPEIRAAFTDNLFHGFARIAWMFQT